MEKSFTNSANRTLELSNIQASYIPKSVVYVMSRDQRVKDNIALLEAQKFAINNHLPLAVIFVLSATGSVRSKEHYEFMLNGLKYVEADLIKLNIPFILLIGKPQEKLNISLLKFQPLRVFMDFNPLAGPKKLTNYISKLFSTTIVDNHNIVPTWISSPKQEYGARTIRPKIHKLITDYLSEPGNPAPHPINWPSTYFSINDLAKLITSELATLRSNNIKIDYSAGEVAAANRLDELITHKLANYQNSRNDPSQDGLSNLSPYLHFGQISSLRIILETQKAAALNSQLQPGFDTLFEELVIRKELSDNYCYYNSNYKSLAGAPEWAQKTLTKHSLDIREYVYSLEQFEKSKTHDSAWNAAQNQLIKTGKIHGYMRMYWAKKILEWSNSPQEALNILLYLNDFYSIDGGDPNGYVGILWSIAGLHDRPWGERQVYGSVRCMVYGGLSRKFDIKKYIQQNS